MSLLDREISRRGFLKETVEYVTALGGSALLLEANTSPMTAPLLSFCEAWVGDSNTEAEVEKIMTFLDKVDFTQPEEGEKGLQAIEQMVAIIDPEAQKFERKTLGDLSTVYHNLGGFYSPENTPLLTELSRQVKDTMGEAEGGDLLDDFFFHQDWKKLCQKIRATFIESFRVDNGFQYKPDLLRGKFIALKVFLEYQPDEGRSRLDSLNSLSWLIAQEYMSRDWLQMGTRRGDPSFETSIEDLDAETASLAQEFIKEERVRNLIRQIRDCACGGGVEGRMSKGTEGQADILLNETLLQEYANQGGFEEKEIIESVLRHEVGVHLVDVEANFGLIYYLSRPSQVLTLLLLKGKACQSLRDYPHVLKLMLRNFPAGTSRGEILYKYNLPVDKGELALALSFYPNYAYIYEVIPDKLDFSSPGQQVNPYDLLWQELRNDGFEIQDTQTPCSSLSEYLSQREAELKKASAQTPFLQTVFSWIRENQEALEIKDWLDGQSLHNLAGQIGREIGSLAFFDHYFTGVLIPLVISHLLVYQPGFQEMMSQEKDFSPTDFVVKTMQALKEADMELFAQIYPVFASYEERGLLEQSSAAQRETWQQFKEYQRKIREFLAEAGVVLAPWKKVGLI